MKAYPTLFVILILVWSCNPDLSDYNDDPTKLTEVSSRYMLPAIQAQAYKNIGSQPMRVAGIIMNQLVGDDICGPMNYYLIGRDVMDNYWRGGAYAGSLINAKTLESLATDREEPFYRGVARIFIANEFGVLTSCFGNIPFNQALKGDEFPQPEYDKQEDVYEGIQSMLDNAIIDLTEAITNNKYNGLCPYFKAIF